MIRSRRGRYVTNFAVGVASVAGTLLVLTGVQHGPARLDAHAAGFVNADRPGINAHNSPAVAADPHNPAVVALADRIDTPRFSCSVSLSTSAGVTWKPLSVPLPAGAPNCYWPDVAFSGDGHLLVLFTATGGRYNQPVGVWLQRYERPGGGDTMDPAGPAVQVAGGEAFHAHLAADGSRVWVAWVQTPPANADRPLGFEPGSNPIMLARSADGGLTFSPPVTVSEPGRRVAQPRVVVTGPNALLVGALDYGDDVFDYEAQHGGQGGPPPAAHWNVVVWLSTDGGATFPPTATVVVAGLPVPQREVIDLAPGPSFAADPAAGRVYAAWDAGVGTNRDVFVDASTDGGAHWLSARRVGPTRQGQLLPAVDVAPNGRVDVVFYDRSRDPNDVLADAAVASSWDGGATFTTARASDQRFDTRIGTGSVQGLPQLGNQLAVLSRADGFLAFWADTSRGSISSNVQDLAMASVTAGRHGSRRWAVVAIGLLVLVAAVAAAVQQRRARATSSAGSAPRR